MTDENLNVEVIEDELETLKARADLMGVSYHPNIGVANLRARLEEQLETKGLETEEAAPEVVETTLTPAQLEAQRINRLRKEAIALKRIRVTCMNPNKKEWEGEVFTVANSVVGTQKKYVPFNTEWHVPQIILNMIQERECQVFYTVVDPRTRQKSRKGKQTKEFAVEILPMLDEKQLKDLAQRQQMASGTTAAA